MNEWKIERDEGFYALPEWQQQAVEDYANCIRGPYNITDSKQRHIQIFRTEIGERVVMTINNEILYSVPIWFFFSQLDTLVQAFHNEAVSTLKEVFHGPYIQMPGPDEGDTYWFEMFYQGDVKPFPVSNRWILIWDYSDEINLAYFEHNEGDDLMKGIWKVKGSNWDYHIDAIKRWAYIGEGRGIDRSQFVKNAINKLGHER